MTTKSKKVAPIPRGFRALTPHLTVVDVTAASAFYQRALGAVEVDTTNFAVSDVPAFAELRVGNSLMTLGQGEPVAPGGISLHHYVENFDAAWASATSQGFVELSAPAETSWGDMMGELADPFGVRWSIAQRVTRLTKEEKAERALALVSGTNEAEISEVALTVGAISTEVAPAEQRLN